ncbi:phosphorothioated DNA-binding restriction endonuclease [Desulfobacula sp.]|uniref:phosphorothioated DNA-binding restriction endonuclease n=1 Tax=Desulfobacula sp. TaxID=2593537 RepID=UPI00345DAED6
MNNQNIKNQFKKITMWKRNGVRSPHKPLMVLYAIGCLLRNKERLISYEEIDKDVAKLLQDFGPQRKSYHPEYPFWRLQKDGIWEIEHSEKLNLKLNNSGDVKKKDLIENRIRGGFKNDIYKNLIDNQMMIKEIIQEILEDNFPQTIHEDILQAVGIDINLIDNRVKTRSPKFRDKILRAYEYRCAIFGFDVRMGHFPVALEAAHIKWHNAGGPDTEINGLALCSLLHKLFDRGAYTVSNDLIILVSSRANGTEGFKEWLMKFHGKKLRMPQRTTYSPDQAYTDWHVSEVFQGEFREVVNEYG